LISTPRQAINTPIFRDGEWSLCERSGWADNPRFQNLLAWSWMKDNDRSFIVVNQSDSAVHVRVSLPWDGVRATTWRLIDALSDARCERDGDEMASSGLYIELEPWNYHFFRCYHAEQRSPDGNGTDDGCS
jgi:hypothetical protein